MKIILATLPDKITPQEVDLIKVKTQTYGTQINLDGIPPHNHTSLYYQILTGLGPEWTNTYSQVRGTEPEIIHTSISEIVEGKLIWDLVQAVEKVSPKNEFSVSESSPSFFHLHANSVQDLEPLFDLTDNNTIKVVLLPNSVDQNQYKTINLNKFFEGKELLERTRNKNILWEETIAYHVGYGQIRINLAGREPTGVVTPGQEYNQICLALAEMLEEQLIDPDTNQSVIKCVWQKEELYTQKGDYFVNGPDLVLSCQPGYVPSDKSISSELDEDTVITGSSKEKINNFLTLMWGNGIKRNYSTTSHTLNVVPTLLYILDLPIPKLLEGDIAKDIFIPGFWSHPIRYQIENKLSADEEALLLDRLEALGYID